MKYGRTEAEIPQINVDDVALIFEGGGTRASHTSAVVAKLIEQDINFSHVYGVSAGSSNAVNYLSRDIPRSEESFTGYTDNPDHIGWKRVIAGEYFFDGPWVYDESATRYAGTGDAMEFDFEMFKKNPAQVHVEAYDIESGQGAIWTKDDMPDCLEMMRKVRASSSLPGFMEPCHIGGRTYLDGGLTDNCGIALMPAINDGFSKFFIVRTQPKGYRKKPMNPLLTVAAKRAFRDHPNVWQRMQKRPYGYNDLCEKIEGLERAGAAYVYYPEIMKVNNRTTDVDALRSALNDGKEQSSREAEAWKTFLGI